MKEPIQPYELSGLLDGELDPQRAAEVLNIIKTNPELGAEFDRLRKSHKAWIAAASQSAFKPKVELPAARGQPIPVALVVALGIPVLVAVRCLAELIPTLALTAPIQGLALAGIIAGALWILKKTRSLPLGASADCCG